MGIMDMLMSCKTDGTTEEELVRIMDTEEELVRIMDTEEELVRIMDTEDTIYPAMGIMGMLMPCMTVGVTVVMAYTSDRIMNGERRTHGTITVIAYTSDRIMNGERRTHGTITDTIYQAMGIMGMLMPCMTVGATVVIAYTSDRIMNGERRTHGTITKQLVRSGARRERGSKLNNEHLANKSGSTLIDAVSPIVRLPLLFAVLCVFGHGVEATSHQRLTLTAGQTGEIPILHEWSTSLPSVPYHTIGYEDIERPFYRGERMYPDGLKEIDQQDRLTTSYVYHTHSLSVNLTLDPVKAVDEGTFVSTVFFTDTNTDRSSFLVKIEVSVYTPPSPADCFISTSPHSERLIYAVCSAKVGSGHTSLTCFQNGEKVPYDEPNVEYPGFLTRNSWVVMMFPISCCSYEEGHHITEETCDDFKWPPPTTTVKPSTPLPSSPASCFIIPTLYGVDLFQTVCSTTVGSSNVGLACYQNGLKVPYEEVKGDVSEVFTLRFWVTMTSPISCCSYEEENAVTMGTCDDFRWPPVTPWQKSTTMSTPPVDDGLLPNNDDFSTVSPPKGSACRTQCAFLSMLINVLVAFIALDI